MTVGGLVVHIVLLEDYRGAFWSSTTNAQSLTTMDKARLRDAFARHGHSVQFLSFSRLDDIPDWNGVPFLYTSSEDPGLCYKSYIEDRVLQLELLGARPIPGFAMLRAHHNKVFMELLRRVYLASDPMTGATLSLGALEELNAGARLPPTPAFVKEAAGAGSSTVRLARTPRQLRKLVSRASLSYNGLALEYARRILRPEYAGCSTHRNKFVVQAQIQGLSGDFKVLRYGERYFPVYRRNRTRDVRASGGGRLDFDVEKYVDPELLIRYSHEVSESLPSPFLSMDVALTETGFSLIEFQALHFGPAALEKSKRHWTVDKNGRIDEVIGPSQLELVFAEAASQAVLQLGHNSS